MDIESKKWDLEFSTRRSCRYHSRRKGYFEFLHKISTFLIIVLSSGSFLSIYSQTYIQPAWIALVITLIATGDLVIGFSSMANKHEMLYRKFNELLIEIDTAQNPSEELISNWKRKRLTIEADEPPIYRALDSSCHNEECRSSGCDEGEFVPISYWQRRLRHLLRFSEVNWKKVSERKL